MGLCSTWNIIKRKYKKSPLGKNYHALTVSKEVGTNNAHAVKKNAIEGGLIVKDTQKIAFCRKHINISESALKKLVELNKPIGELPIPTKVGEIFQYWTIDGEIINENTIFIRKSKDFNHLCVIIFLAGGIPKPGLRGQFRKLLVGQPSGGSNPSSSARINNKKTSSFGLFFFFKFGCKKSCNQQHQKYKQ